METKRQSPVALNLTGDEIDRAMSRNAVRPGSPLETNVRERAFFIWGGAVAISAAKPGDLGRKLDIYIAEQRGNPAFADSFATVRPKAQISARDQQALWNVDIQRVANGEIEVID